MAKKVKTDKKLYIAKPICMLQDREIAYISSSFIQLVYDDSTNQPQEYRFMLSKRASYISIPDRDFEIKITKNGEIFLVDVSIFYQKNLVLQPEPLSFVDINKMYPAQKINYAYFSRKRLPRLSFLSALDEMLMFADSVFKYGPLNQEDRDRFEYVMGWSETKFPVWANKLSLAQIVQYIANFETDIQEIDQPYKIENSSNEQYNEIDLAMVGFLTEMIEILEQRLMQLIEKNVLLIQDLDEVDRATIIAKCKEKEQWTLLAKLRDSGIKIPD